MKGVDEKIFPSKSLHTSYFQEHSSKRLTSEKPVSRSLSLIVGMKEPTTVRRILEEQCKPSNMRGEVWEGVETEAPQCKTLFTFGYGYRQFFHMPPNKNARDGNLFAIKFQVKARSDAHILLSPSPSPEEDDPVYEIVLGAGRNSFSDIRRRRRANTKTSAFTSDILSGTELKGFWVKMNQEGIIQVGGEGEDLAFMQWQDPEPLDIQYFSFCTWSGVAGKWLYDCALTDNDIGSIAVETPETSVDKLRKALLTNYDVYSRPVMNASDLTNISVQIEVNHVDIDIKKSVLTVACTFILVWTDEKMIWNPENFDNLSRLNLVHHEIWQPQLIHFNAVGKEVSPFTRTGMQVSSEGQVRWRPHSYLQSRCQLDLRSWPWDTQTCSVYLGSLNQPDTLHIVIPETGPILNMQKTSSEWEVMDLKAKTTDVKMSWLLDPTNFLWIGTDDTVSSSALSFTFTLKRVNHGYYYTLIIPILVIVVMSLSCFWMDPLGKEKLVTNCLLLILLCAFLMSLEYTLSAPADHTPFLFKVYGWVLAVVGFATVISVFICNLVSLPQLQPPPRLLINILSSQFFSTLCCLPKSHIADDDYGQLCEEERGTSLTSWGLLAVVCDRIAFITALIAYTAILIC